MNTDDTDQNKRAMHLRCVMALPQKSILAVTSFVFSSCDFVDRSFCPEKTRTIHEVTRTNTKQNTPASS